MGQTIEQKSVLCSGQCSMVRAPACGSKGHGFHSQSRHVPPLQDPQPQLGVGVGVYGKQLIYVSPSCFFFSVSLSLHPPFYFIQKSMEKLFCNEDFLKSLLLHKYALCFRSRSFFLISISYFFFSYLASHLSTCPNISIKLSIII